jgi:4-amino-4-deoxy-L-arabinose transferase-like glycosyltransferase
MKWTLPERVGWRDHAVGAGLGAAYVTWLLSTARSLGFARDEGFYFTAATQYARWFELLFTHPTAAFVRQNVDSMWAYNHEHPAFMKSLFALSWMALHEKCGVFADASTAFRLPTMLMAGAVVWVTYLFGARAFGRRAGLFAAALFALMPRVFYHAHLACFDVGIVAMWTLTIYVYWRATQTGGLGWALLLGLVYGLTLETKHNAWVLPAVVVPHTLFVYRRSFCRNLRLGRVSVPATLVAMATIGPLVFFALWPWLWWDTSARLEFYVNFHLKHEYYNMEFLGRNYFRPPFPAGYMPLMIAATVPTITLVLAMIGVVRRASVHAPRVRAWVRRATGREGGAAARSPSVDPTETDLLLAFAFFAALVPWFSRETPIFGGTKHWLTAYPFLALFAGHGADWIARRIGALLEGRVQSARIAAQAGLAAAVLLPPLAITVHSHPFGLSSYVPLVGGTAGGATLGLNRQYWGFTTQSAAPSLERAPPGASVYVHDTGGESWHRMQDEGRVRRDLRVAGQPADAQVALYQYELHTVGSEYNIWMSFGASPAYVVAHDGVPIVNVYTRP